MTAEATCDPATLVGYVYRDPAGTDVYVAQSDVARCEVELVTRRHPLASWAPPARLTAPLAAMELHLPAPLPGVRYVSWDGTSVADAGSTAR